MLSNTENLSSQTRVRVQGKFFRAGVEKWYLRGFTYGPFAQNSLGEHLPEREVMRADFAKMRELGANAIRLYFPPSHEVLDWADEEGLRVLIDVPWEKHRCFFEDWAATNAARQTIRRVAQEFGEHPAVLAISVVNEFPNDVVRFYGHQRFELFVDELLDIVHQNAPDCLATFANFPTTEFLQPRNVDFHCFNVYLHDPQTLGAYLDRLQHLTGSLPLILGEYGVDSLRNGETEQAEQIVHHVERVFQHGLAGSFVFSYTDDWFTGGHQIEDWAFGVTRRDRTEKPAAQILQAAWSKVPALLDPQHVPSVSVVVCSYNGARTLEECLNSLMRLNYPDYEVILVDDGSTDATAEIARQFPQVRSIGQENWGLSVARNVGAQAALGEIVAYTDDDCVADPDWLNYLVRAMEDQHVDAIGGPNITPLSDGWTARCVAVSPGNPSHVMLDDHRAEHVPGCNMAFRRDVLLGMGGFDPQFRQAGDDVDLCWRLLDDGRQIGFASAAMVWHHRRCTVRAYLKQQKGYGRSEAMVQFKHPHRFAHHGRPIFHGVIYGDGAVGLPVLPPRIYHGRYGSAPFQTIYRQQTYRLWSWMTSLEWHALALILLVLGVLHPVFWSAAGTMWLGTLGLAISYGFKANLPREAPVWCRPLVMFLHLAQPLLRGWHRCHYRLTHKKLPRWSDSFSAVAVDEKRISRGVRDLYWENQEGIGREQLLEELEQEAANVGWPGDFHANWTPWDVQLDADLWHSVRVYTVTEELGWPRRYTRARSSAFLTLTSKIVAWTVLLWMLVAILTRTGWAVGLGAAFAMVLLGHWEHSRSRCLRQVSRLLVRAAVRAELQKTPETIPFGDPQPAAINGYKPVAVPQSFEPVAVHSYSSQNSL